MLDYHVRSAGSVRIFHQKKRTAHRGLRRAVEKVNRISSRYCGGINCSPPPVTVSAIWLSPNVLTVLAAAWEMPVPLPMNVELPTRELLLLAAKPVPVLPRRAVSMMFAPAELAAP